MLGARVGGGGGAESVAGSRALPAAVHHGSQRGGARGSREGKPILPQGSSGALYRQRLPLRWAPEENLFAGSGSQLPEQGNAEWIRRPGAEHREPGQGYC